MSNIKYVDSPRHAWDTPLFLLIVSSTPSCTICGHVRTLDQSRDNQTKRGWPFSIRGSSAIRCLSKYLDISRKGYELCMKIFSFYQTSCSLSSFFSLYVFFMEIWILPINSTTWRDNDVMLLGRFWSYRGGPPAPLSLVGGSQQPKKSGLNSVKWQTSYSVVIQSKGITDIIAKKSFRVKKGGTVYKLYYYYRCFRLFELSIFHTNFHFPSVKNFGKSGFHYINSEELKALL